MQSVPPSRHERQEGLPWRPFHDSRQAAVLDAVNDRGAVRITDLAEELGVTAVTMRRDISTLAQAGLVRRVHGGATALRHDGGASSRAGSTRLGALVPSLDFYWPDVARGAEEEATRLGMDFTLRGSVYHATDERADLDRLVSGGIAGLLLAPTVTGPAGEALREWLGRSPVPVVLMERSADVGPSRQGTESVLTDHAGGAAMAVHYLGSLGHRRVGIVRNARSPHTEQIRAGWHRAATEVGLTTKGVTDIELPDQWEPGFEDAIEAAVSTAVSTGTTALLVHSDPEAVRVLQVAEERGVSVPRDLSIVSYDDQVAELATPALSAVRPPRRTIGRTAVSLLTARIEAPDRPVHRVYVSPSLHVRNSSGPVPAPA